MVIEAPGAIKPGRQGMQNMPSESTVQDASRAAANWNLRGLGAVAFAHGASDLYSGMVPFLIFAVVIGSGLSPVFQGAIGFLWYLTSSITQPLFGAFTDARGRWWFLPLAVSLTVCGVSFAGIAGGLGVLAALIALGGLGSGMMHPEAGKYAAMLSGARRSGGISIFQIGGSAGYALGPLIAATLIQAHGTRGLLWMLIPGAGAVLLLLAAMPRVDRTARHLHGAASGDIAEKAGGIERLGVMLLVTGTAAEYIVSASFVTYLPNVIVARGGDVAFAGGVATAFLMASVLGLYVGGYLGDRIGPLRVSIGGQLLAVPFLFGFLALRGWGSIALLLAANALLNVQTAPVVALIQRLLPRNLGMALGLVNGVAFGIGSALVTAVGVAVARIGADAALMRVSLLPVLGALLFLSVAWRLSAPRHGDAASDIGGNRARVGARDRL